MNQYTKPAKWPLFHHPFTSTYYNHRICLLGDVAHASSPSQAAGAGQGLEDALVLSKLLGKVKSADQLENAFEAYDAIRRPRAQGMVQESLDVMVAYYLIHPKFGHDLQKITDEANRRLPLIWWHDLEADVATAEQHFARLNSSMGTDTRKEHTSARTGKADSSGVFGIFRLCFDFIQRLF
jgi:salicylate hydroxylase